MKNEFENEIDVYVTKKKKNLELMLLFILKAAYFLLNTFIQFRYLYNNIYLQMLQCWCYLISCICLFGLYGMVLGTINVSMTDMFYLLVCVRELGTSIVKHELSFFIVDPRLLGKLGS